MPAFRASETIRVALEGILKQTHAEWELWIILDGEDEKALAIIDSHQQSDRRIQCLRSRKNRGVVRSRNLGVRMARGAWIAFCDADDYWLPHKLEHQLRFASKNNLTLLGSGFWFWQPQVASAYRLAVLPSLQYKEKLYQTNALPMSTAMYHVATHGKQYFETLPSPYIHEDYAFWLQLCKRSNPKIGLLNEPLVCIRQHDHSRSANKRLAFRSHAYILRQYVGLSMWRMSIYLFTYGFYAWIKRRGPMPTTSEKDFLDSCFKPIVHERV
ncbi:MAG: hypothetical protein C0424_12000 [Sphingobacteriaceae bacterium]|nr:hypothetical protein [Sphingobacteriaceae bacterium]